jgi:purine nucleosidase
LFDAVVVAYATHPELCPTEPMRLRVDDQGYTRVESGPPNAQVCLRSSSDQFLEFFMPRILAPLKDDKSTTQPQPMNTP